MDDKISEPVSETDAKLLKGFGGVGLVMTIIFTISSLQREIELSLRKIARFRIEPRMMSDQFNKPTEEASEFDSPPDQYSRSYKFRMKAMDKMGELDDLICSINNKYARRKGQSVRGYLKMLQKHPYNVIKGGNETIDKLADMYEHARFETKEFGNVQYKKFAYLVEQIKDRVRLYTNVPGSLIINSSSKQPKKPPLSSTKVADASQQDEQKDKEGGKAGTSSPGKDEQHELLEMNVKVDEGVETKPVVKSKDSKVEGTETKESGSKLEDTVVLVHRVKENIGTGNGEQVL